MVLIHSKIKRRHTKYFNTKHSSKKHEGVYFRNNIIFISKRKKKSLNETDIRYQ